MKVSSQSSEGLGLDVELIGPSINNKDSMKYETKKMLDTYAFWGVVAAVAGCFWWFVDKLG